MSLNMSSFRLTMVALLCLSVAFATEKGPTAPSIELISHVGSVTAMPGSGNVVIPVYMTNIFDSVQACQLWVVSGMPEVVRFLADSVGGVLYGRVDTSGTRSSGALISARILDAAHGILRVSVFFPSPESCMAPGNGMLIKLLVETDSTAVGGSSVGIIQDHIQTQFVSRHGQTIGCVYDSLGQCTIDTTKLVLIDGSVFLADCISCGDANGDGQVDVSDAVCLILHIFGDPVDPLMDCVPGECMYPKGKGDANGDMAVDISDAVYIIAFVFAGGQTPHCFGL